MELHLNYSSFSIKIYLALLFNFRTNGISDQWDFGPMGFRTNGISDQWDFGIMTCNPIAMLNQSIRVSLEEALSLSAKKEHNKLSRKKPAITDAQSHRVTLAQSPSCKSHVNHQLSVPSADSRSLEMPYNAIYVRISQSMTSKTLHKPPLTHVACVRCTMSQQQGPNSMCPHTPQH